MIKTYTAISVDGSVSRADGWPVQLDLPAFEGAGSHGFPDFLEGVTAVAMGRSTFVPALGAPRWPWPDKQVFVLTSSDLPDETPDHVRRADSVENLLTQLRQVDGDVHVVGGPTLIRGLWECDGIDQLGLFIVPSLIGGGTPLFPLSDRPATLELASSRTHHDGVVEMHFRRAGYVL